MSTEQNKTIVGQVMAALDKRDLQRVMGYYAPDTRFHGWGPETLDRTGYNMVMSDILAAFPDSHFIVDDVVAEGDRVVVRHHLQGTHLATFQGIPATSKSVVVDAIVIMRLDNDKAVELWLNADFMGLMQQLGVVPVPAGT